MGHPLDDWVDHAPRGFRYRHSISALRDLAEDLGYMPKVPVISVAGTNGKGSCVAALAHGLQVGGYRVGHMYSPHLHHVTERIQINHRPINQDVLWNYLGEIQQQTTLTLSYFERLTLAAMAYFKDQGCDYWVMEVGLGGRLDAVNLIDATVAIVTSIGLDHQAVLGSTRLDIAEEKCGIARHDGMLIIAERDWPELKVSDCAKQVYWIDKDFYVKDAVWHGRKNRCDFKRVGLSEQSVMAALMALDILEVWPGNQLNLSDISLPGRYQVIRQTKNTLIFDIAHNDQALLALSKRISKEDNVHLVFSAQEHKSVQQGLVALLPFCQSVILVDCCFSNKNKFLRGYLSLEYSNVSVWTGSMECLKETLDEQLGATILITGSFLTVAHIQRTWGLMPVDLPLDR